MKNKIQPFIFLFAVGLTLSSLVACVSINKTKQNIAVYDFGLSLPSEGNQQISSNLRLEEPIAVASLNHHKIRYRLNYQNPARVFFYAESRWAATPSELLSNKLSQMINIVKTSKTCILKIQIETFDHVFQTAASSDGIVQLNAVAIEKKSQMIIASQLMTESVASSSPDAKGGTIALQQASENALKKVISWGNTVANHSELCQ